MKESRGVSWRWVLAAFVGLFVIGLVAMSATGGMVGSRVAVVSLSGAIADGGGGGLLGGAIAGTRRFMSDLKKATDDPTAKAIVIRINSPGGSAAASQEMYAAVMRARKVKPVYASMGDVAASGGYYVASACDKIYANPATMTGSIGVISQFMNYQELFRKVGLDEATIKSGKFKDAGNPSRKLTPEERALFQRMIGVIYQQFVDDIVAGRKNATGGKLTREKLLKLADGRVYTGTQARDVMLVDKIGGLYDAVQDAGATAGLTGDIVADEIESGGLFGGNGLGVALQNGAASFGEALGSGIGQAAAQSFTTTLQKTSSAPKF